MFFSACAVDMSPQNVKYSATKAAHKDADAPEGDVRILGASGRLNKPKAQHSHVYKTSGLYGRALLDLRRSFASLTEWHETLAGMVAQLQGRNPPSSMPTNSTSAFLSGYSLNYCPSYSSLVTNSRKASQQPWPTVPKNRVPLTRGTRPATKHWCRPRTNLK